MISYVSATKVTFWTDAKQAQEPVEDEKKCFNVSNSAQNLDFLSDEPLWNDTQSETDLKYYQHEEVNSEKYETVSLNDADYYQAEESYIDKELTNYELYEGEVHVIESEPEWLPRQLHAGNCIICEPYFEAAKIRMVKLIGSGSIDVDNSYQELIVVSDIDIIWGCHSLILEYMHIHKRCLHQVNLGLIDMPHDIRGKRISYMHNGIEVVLIDRVNECLNSTRRKLSFWNDKHEEEFLIQSLEYQKYVYGMIKMGEISRMYNQRNKRNAEDNMEHETCLICCLSDQEPLNEIDERHYKCGEQTVTLLAHKKCYRELLNSYSKCPICEQAANFYDDIGYQHINVIHSDNLMHDENCVPVEHDDHDDFDDCDEYEAKYAHRDVLPSGEASEDIADAFLVAESENVDGVIRTCVICFEEDSNCQRYTCPLTGRCDIDAHLNCLMKWRGKTKQNCMICHDAGIH